MHRLRSSRTILALLLGTILANAQAPPAKPPLMLDEFFDSVEIHSVRIAPDGRAVAIETTRADWGANRFR